MSSLEIDFESRSAADLKKVGVYKYMQDPSTRPLFATYKLHGVRKRWDASEPCPPEIVAHVESGGITSAHNFGFERLLWQYILTPRYGWPKLRLEQGRCTAATAAALSLPRDLAGLGSALGLPIQKDKDGWRLIRKFSLPRKPRKGEPQVRVVHCKREAFDVLIDRTTKWGNPFIIGRDGSRDEVVAKYDKWLDTQPHLLADLGDLRGRTLGCWCAPNACHGHVLARRADNMPVFNEPHEHPEDWEKFKKYCDDDVETEAAADARMVPLSEADQARYIRSERINDRGIRLDTASAYAALQLADIAKAELDREMLHVTGGYVTACSQVARLTDWVASRGVAMSSAAKAEIEELLQSDDLPDDVRRAIELRQEAAKTSVSKLSSFLDRVGPDGRIRGAFLFRAAGTGRYSSVGVQLHNMPRPRRIFEEANLDSRTLFAAIRQQSPAYLKSLYGAELGRPLHLLSDAIRGFLWAAPGHDLLAADYSGIEGAVAAWFCGEDWKVDALFEIIADPSLPDLYRRTAAGIVNSTTDIITKKHPLRQSVGKVSELSLGYQGGVAAFYSMSRAYGVKLEPLFEPVWETADEERRERAVKRYEECLERNEVSTQNMTRNAWLAAELIKVGWRATNPAIAASWRLLEDAMFEAVSFPGQVVQVLKVKYLVKGGFLWCLLPSGRCLAYGAPRISDVEVPWADKTQAPEKREKKKTVTALGVNSVTKKFERFALYGGLALENIVQAISLDLLENGIEKAENAGYPVVLHVHDEIVTEVPRGFGSVEDFERIICDLPDWAAGLPLTASGWRGKRYRK